jgi:Domain of unknown function (DUF4276)
VKTVLVLVEGQTEERFIKDVLAPDFYTLDCFFDPRLLITKRVKHGASFKGGVTTYGKFRNDVVRLLGEAQGRIVTTVIDYYGLPGDFPGMSTRPNSTPRERARHVEKKIHEDLGAPPNFLPFLALHEFEAWLFSSRDELPNTLTQPHKIFDFAAIRDSFEDPEQINEGPQTAPSKRIAQLFPDYRKVLHGPVAAKRIGMETIRAECPHFDAWYRQLERLATE